MQVYDDFPNTHGQDPCIRILYGIQVPITTKNSIPSHFVFWTGIGNHTINLHSFLATELFKIFSTPAYFYTNSKNLLCDKVYNLTTTIQWAKEISQYNSQVIWKNAPAKSTNQPIHFWIVLVIGKFARFTCGINLSW